MTPVPDFPTVAVVGAGQLARMLVPPAVALGVGVRVLASSPEDAAARVAPSQVGDHADLHALRRLAAGAAVLTVEHEHVPRAHLEALHDQGIAVRPGPAALAHAQDKLLMRRRLDVLGLPQPAWARADGADATAAAARFARECLQRDVPRVVLKRPRGGYDGRGVAVRDAAELAGGRGDAGGTLVRWAREDGEVLLEEVVPFRRELSVLIARSPSGQVAVWPVVQTLQVDGMCREVVAPAPDLAVAVADEAALTAARLAGELDVTGVMAVEGFETDEAGGPRFLVNELAMRPHNSGHWTIEGAVTSQFEQHLRAVLDLPLGRTEARSPVTVMVNVVGADHPELYSAYRHVMARDPGVKVHLYGKAVRPGRKIGHVTVSGDSAGQLLDRARHAAEYIAGVIDG